MHTAYTIRLSINKDLKLKERKGKEKKQIITREVIYNLLVT